MTKAERIFQNTRSTTIKHIKQWGYNNDVDGGWGGGWCTETAEHPEGELIYQRTFNELQRMLDSKGKDLERMIKFKIHTPEKAAFELKVYQMMCKTAKNTYIVGK